jgi:lipopolysaccharide/colanic/teichoic acid biosynthesis glycosyltransferase
MDLLLAGPGLLLITPMLLVIAVLVLTVMGPPVLFRHVRAGYKGRAFTLRKFRTMSDVRDAQGRLRPDEERITRLGRFLRSFSLDELPELLNVLRGEMSLVGPRPLLLEYVPRYTAEQRRRLDVLPGMTGWAQINGRNAPAWPDKFRMDVWYVDHWSLWLDLKILGLTLWKAAKREGISQQGYATAPEFKGED